MSIVVNREGPRVTLTIDRWARRNSFDRKTLEDLISSLRAAQEDPEVRVIVLTAVESLFSAGADMNEPAGDSEGSNDRWREVFQLIAGGGTPVIARVNGGAYGGSLGIIASADIAIGTAEAQFCFSEVRLGSVATGALVCCGQKMSLAVLLDLALTGDIFDGRQAAEAGLLTRAVPAAELDAAVERSVASILQGAPSAIAMTKGLIRGLARDAMSAGEALAAEVTVNMAATPEFTQGRQAFFERKPPPWQV